MAIVSRRNVSEGSQLSRPRRTDPFEVMKELMRFDPVQAFSEFAPLMTRGELDFVPSFDVKETKDSYVFKGDLPGVKDDEIEISLTGNRLTVSGNRPDEKREETDQYFAHERSCGTFWRSFTLPGDIDPDKVQAEFKDGVLSVVVAKKPEAQPKRIDLKASKTEKDKSAKA